MHQSSADNVSQSVKPEERLFPLWKLIGFALGVLVLMGMLFGNQEVLQQVANIDPPDDISLFFLKNIQQKYPKDHAWRILYARQQLELGDLSDAQRTVTPLLISDDSVIQKEARLIDLQIIEMQMMVKERNDQEKRKLRSTMATRIRELLHHSMSPTDLVSLADSALLAEDWELTIQLYQQLAKADPSHAADWLRKGAKLALGRGAYSQAADLFFSAKTQNQSFEDKREDYLSALKALISGNKIPEALVQAEKYLGSLDGDEAILKFLVKLGRAAGDGTFAQKYVEKLLQISHMGRVKIFATFTSGCPAFLSKKYGIYPCQNAFRVVAQQEARALVWKRSVSSTNFKRYVSFQETLPPYNSEIYELAYQVYAENGEIERAYEIARAASGAVPADVPWRRRWAQGAEWTGRPAEALQQWQVVAQQQPSAAVWATVVRLGRSLMQSTEGELAQAALELVVAQGPAAEQRVARWALLEMRHQQALASEAPAVLGALRTQLQALLADVQTLAEGEQLLQVSLAHGQWAEAEAVLAQLAGFGTKAQGQGWYQHSAEAALGQGAYRQAAGWWFVVQELAETPEQQRAAFQAGLQALVAGQELTAVAPAVQAQLGQLGTDQSAVVSAVRALRAAGARAEASQVLRQLWGAGEIAYEPAIYELAYRVYAENEEIERAYEIARAASGAVPADVPWRRRWAQGAEWTGRPAEALQQWQVVAQQQPSAAVWATVVRLGRSLMQSTEGELAQAALELVVAQGPAAEQRVARWALLEMRHQQALASEAPAVLGALRTQLQALLADVQTLAEGEQLLQVSLAHGQWAEAEAVLAQLAGFGTKAQGQGWYQHSAEAALGQGAYRQAAGWWFVVQELAETPEQQRAAFQAGLQALVAGQELTAVAPAVQAQLGQLGTDQSAVVSAVRALRAAGARAEASQVLRQLWGAGEIAYEPAIYELAYRVYAENEEIERAYEIARAASGAVPADVPWRRRWAQGAEWTGRPAEALQQWQVVAQQQPSAAVWATVVRLGRSLMQSTEGELAQAALELVVAQGPAVEQRVARWALLEMRHQQALASEAPAVLGALRTQLQALLADVQTLAEGEQLLQVSLAHGQWAEAEAVLAQLAGFGTKAQGQGWYQHSAEAALGQGAYRQAAGWWFVVQELAETPEQQRAAFQAGLQALVAGQELTAVAPAVQAQLGQLGTDQSAVVSAVRALRAAGARAEASQVLRQLWGAGEIAYEPAIYELAYRVYAENEEIERAYEIARAASGAVPADVPWRRRWAQGAEWTGRPAEALQQWQVVAQQQPSAAVWATVVRLGRSLMQSTEGELAQAALELVVAQGPAAEQRVARWALLEMRHQQALASEAPAVLGALRTQLQALLADVQTLAEGEQLLQVSLAHGQWAEAEAVLAQLAGFGTKAQGQGWYQHSAEAALGQGAYRQAAGWWFVVQELAETPEQQRAAFQAGLQALVAGQELTAVAPAVQAQLGQLGTDQSAVVSAVRALRAAGARAEASQVLRQLWGAGEIAYEPAIYELAYRVYAENEEIERAYEIARAASGAVPADVPWRRRWAQGAEWTGRPAEALQQWQVVAQQQPSAAVWATVVRLGRSLREFQVVASGLENLKKDSGLSLQQMKELADVYEQLGEPQKAILQLQAEFQKEPKKEMLERIIAIYERMGNVQEATQTFAIIREQFGSTLDMAKKQATLLYQQGKIPEALEVLVEKQDIAFLDTAYWQTLGDIAWDLQNDVVSRQAYEKLFELHKILPFELERLVLLEREGNPDRAIELAQKGWKWFGKVGLYLLALDLLQEKKEWNAIGSMLEGVTRQQHQLLGPHPQYWLVRGEFFSQKGKVDEAMLAYQEALRQDPYSSSIRLTMLWFLLDSQQLNQLEPWLVKWKENAETDPRFWSVFASAYMSLDQPVKALPYFEKKFQKIPQDFLWAVYYADALERAKLNNRARDLRQYAWLTLRKKVQLGKDHEWNRDAMMAYARLALTRESGDRVSSIFSRLLRQKQDAAVKELVLAWYLSREEFSPTRFWLWRYYGRQLSRPGFAAIAVALHDNDWVAVDRLLTNIDSPLDRLEKVAAAQHLRREPLLQTLAFEGAEKSSVSGQYAEALSNSVLPHITSLLDTHQRLPLTAQLWSRVPHVDTRLKFQDRGPLRSQQVEHLWSLPLGRGVELFPFVSRRWQQNLDEQSFRRLPRTDTRIGAHLQWDMGLVFSEVSLYYRRALSSLLAFRGRTQMNWGRRLTSEILVGRNLEADTSVGMLVGGVKDLARMSHSYQVSKWDSAFLQIDYPRFYAQDRKFLGQGFAIEGAWAHHFRLAYPDINIRLSGSLQEYSNGGSVSGKLLTLFPSRSSTFPVSSVLPESFRQLELGAGVGESVFFTYGSSLRPFAFGGVNLNPETDVGAHISGGVNGSLFGSDRLSLYGRYLRGEFGQDSIVTEWGLHYQLWF